MSFIVKGWEHDENCLDCIFQSEDSDRCLLTDEDIPLYGKGHLASCPIVQLPEKHGRLVDADLVAETLIKCAKDPQQDTDTKWFFLFAAKILENCEAIMEAEGKE